MKIELDGEIADQITILNLKQFREYMIETLDAHKNGEYLHSDDLVEYEKAINAMNVILRYFGER